MTGNVALDVVIGLVFIYTLYSLLTTTVVELIATYLQLRARNLVRGIERMLDDDKKPLFSKKFYETPLIKYMASGLWRIYNKPSYLQARNFSKALIHVLKDEVDGDTKPSDKIRAALEKYKDTQTGKFLLNLLDEADNDLVKFTTSLDTWFDDTMERVGGWYKRKITVITFLVGLVVATIFNVDTFQVVNKLSYDKNAREQYIQLAGQLASDTSLMQTKTIRDTLINDMNKLHSYSTQSIDILGSKRPKGIYFYSSVDNFWGCLLTAIALSLGSPFWFDLLSKLMKLRGAIMKPAKQAEDNEEKKNTTKTP